MIMIYGLVPRTFDATKYLTGDIRETIRHTNSKMTFNATEVPDHGAV